MVSLDVPLPTLEELTVPEIKLTTAPLLAASLHLGKYCDHQSKEFMLCHYESRDPRKCINEGKAVTACGHEFFNSINKYCHNEFKRYYTCVHKYSGPSYSLESCRSFQQSFDGCIKMHLGQDRPESGYFNRVRLHKTNRLKPEPQLAPMPERIPDLPDFTLSEEPKHMKERLRMPEVIV